MPSDPHSGSDPPTHRTRMMIIASNLQWEVIKSRSAGSQKQGIVKSLLKTIRFKLVISFSRPAKDLGIIFLASTERTPKYFFLFLLSIFFSYPPSSPPEKNYKNVTMFNWISLKKIQAVSIKMIIIFFSKECVFSRHPEGDKQALRCRDWVAFLSAMILLSWWPG